MATYERDTFHLHHEERAMTEEERTRETDPKLEAEDQLLGAQAYLEETLHSGGEDERWKAMTSLEIATQGRNLAHLASRVQALEEMVRVLLESRREDIATQLGAISEADA
jgi:hypothetical protein